MEKSIYIKFIDSKTEQEIEIKITKTNLSQTVKLHQFIQSEKGKVQDEKFYRMKGFQNLHKRTYKKPVKLQNKNQGLEVRWTLNKNDFYDYL